MKAGLFIAGLVQLAAAQPHHNHQQLHEKRAVVTKIDVVTATTPDVVVFVNQFGEPVSTSYLSPWLRPHYKSHHSSHHHHSSSHHSSSHHSSSHHSSSHHAMPSFTSSPAAEPTVEPTQPAPSTPAPVAPTSTPVVAPPPPPPTSTPVVAPPPPPPTTSAAPPPPPSTTPAPSPPPPTTVAPPPPPPTTFATSTSAAALPPPPPPPPSHTSSAPAATSSVSTPPPSVGGYGVTYSPYNADGTCKSQAQVNTDFAQLGAFSLVRTYGVDCNQLNTVGSAAAANNMQRLIGIYNIGASLSGEVSQVIAYANSNWDNVHSISIGNELVNSNQASVSDVVNAVNSARAQLQAAGYHGPVVTVDTFVAVLNHPELCQVSDYAAINAHAFFDNEITADKAGSYVSGVVAQVAAACNKKVFVTESGWPNAGQANGAAVPSPQNQQAAISSLRAAFGPSEIVLFNAYNDLWKQNFPGSFGAEQAWGMFGNSHA